MDTASPSFADDRERIEHEASVWAARHDRGLIPPEIAEFATWLAADARHRSAYCELSGTWTGLDAASALRPTHGVPDPDLLLRSPAPLQSPPRLHPSS